MNVTWTEAIVDKQRDTLCFKAFTSGVFSFFSVSLMCDETTYDLDIDLLWVR